MAKKRRRYYGTLLIEKEWISQALYYRWKLLLFATPQSLSTLRVESNSHFGTQDKAVKNAFNCAECLQIQIDRQCKYPKDEVAK